MKLSEVLGKSVEEDLRGTDKGSLKELVGKHPLTDLSLENLSEFLGERTPEIPLNNVGRIRLIRALKQRFGPQFRLIPGVKKLLKEFDEKIQFEKDVMSLKTKGKLKNG